MHDSTPHAALLEAENASLRTENEALRARVEELQQLNEVLRRKVDAMARKLFGKSSEKLDAAQLQMVFDALQDNAPPGDEAKKTDASALDACGSEVEEATTGTTAPTKRRKLTLEEKLDHLPVDEIIIVPEEVKADPEAWTCMGQEVTRQIDYRPGQFRCRKIIRQKFVRRDARHQPPVIAPLRTLQERCIASPRLLAHIATCRFELHLPYYRIEKTCARLGLGIPRHTMCGWTGMAHESSALIIEHIKREVFADGCVQVDETPVKFQDSLREGKCGTGWLWVIYNPGRNVCLFVWSLSRGAEALDTIVPPAWQGTIQCDGHSAYEAFIKRPGRAGSIMLAGCMAHARRKFYEAKDESEDARRMLAHIGQLYHIEGRLRDARAGPAEVLEERQQQSAPIMARIKERLDHLHNTRQHTPRSLTGEAITYARNQWDKLCVCLNDGRVQIDNNLVENSIRPSAIGKKNWLFMGDATTGSRAATFYTLIGNAQRAGINAEAYLADIFERLPSETNQTVHRLTPQTWAAEQTALRQALAQSAVVPV